MSNLSVAHARKKQPTAAAVRWSNVFPSESEENQIGHFEGHLNLNWMDGKEISLDFVSKARAAAQFSYSQLLLYKELGTREGANLKYLSHQNHLYNAL
jgi:hypothetical protein